MRRGKEKWKKWFDWFRRQEARCDWLAAEVGGVGFVQCVGAWWFGGFVWQMILAVKCWSFHRSGGTAFPLGGPSAHMSDRSWSILSGF